LCHDLLFEGAAIHLQLVLTEHEFTVGTIITCLTIYLKIVCN